MVELKFVCICASVLIRHIEGRNRENEDLKKEQESN
jgi:hypothetical protein